MDVIRSGTPDARHDAGANEGDLAPREDAHDVHHHHTAEEGDDDDDEMGVSLVIDDTTLALLVVLIGALALNIYTARAATPLLHPLLLARQAEVSTVRQPAESAVYRNSNSPTGFDLAAKPRREIVDVRSLVQLGVSGAEIEHPRRLLGHRSTISNRQVLAHIQALAATLTDAGSAGAASTTLFVAGADQHPSYAVLIGLLASTARGVNGAIQVIALPPSSSPAFASALRNLPEAVLSKSRAGGFALLASPKELDALQAAENGTALHSLLGLTATSSTSSPVIIIDDTRPTFSASLSTTTSLPLARTLTFTQVVNSNAGSDAVATADPDPPLTRAAKLVAWFSSPRLDTQEPQWVPASNAVLVAGVTAQLSLYPADKIPAKSDELLLALEEPTQPTPALSLGHPAGLALALTALYTGASLRTQSLASLRAETGEINVSTQVSMLYLPSAAADSLARALGKSAQSRESAWKASPLFGASMRTAALRTLRYGTLPAPRKPAPSALAGSAASLGGSSSSSSSNGHAQPSSAAAAAESNEPSEIRPIPPSYSAPASLGLAHVRAVVLLTHAPAQAVPQSTLDALRLEFGAPVWQVYLPLHALRVVEGEARASASASGEDRQVGEWALVAAPVTAAHSLDLQAFAPFTATATATGGKGGGAIVVSGTHVGAPSVSLEVKLVNAAESADEGRTGDFEGEVAFRGKTVALYAPAPLTVTSTASGPTAPGAAAAGPPRPPAAPPSGHWVKAGQRGSWRSNGTLVLLP